MGEVLHAWALAPAAVGACCMAADRRRGRAPELVGSFVMLLAMVDASLVHALAPVLWGAVLVVAALMLAAVHRGRATVMTVHGTVGLVLMAGLVVTMGAAGPNPGIGGAGGHHAGPALAALGAAAAIGYGAASVVLAGIRHRGADRRPDHARPLARVQAVTMGASVAAMGLALSL